MAQIHHDGGHQVEIILERHHLVLLGLSSLVLGALFFVLGMLTQRHLLSTPTIVEVASTEEQTPPPLFPDRSRQPNVQDKDFEFYRELAGKNQTSPSRSQSTVSRQKPAVSPQRKTAESTSAPAPSDPAGARAQVATERRAATEVAHKRSTLSLQPDHRGTFALQVISVSERSTATNLRKQLRAKGYPAFIDRARLDDGKLVYRVKIGNYGDREKATQVAHMLKKDLGKDAWIHRVSGG